MDMKFDTDVKDNATIQQENNYMISQSPQGVNEKVFIFGNAGLDYWYWAHLVIILVELYYLWL